jgi:hypothetical protein
LLYRPSELSLLLPAADPEREVENDCGEHDRPLAPSWSQACCWLLLLRRADPTLAPWFRSLLQPGTQISCCSLADCRETEYRTNADRYEALVGGNWVSVPPEKILQRTDNPTGHAIVCWTPQRGIMCFVRATES